MDRLDFIWEGGLEIHFRGYPSVLYIYLYKVLKYYNSQGFVSINRAVLEISFHYFISNLFVEYLVWECLGNLCGIVS